MERNTAQRRAIRQVFLDTDRPLSTAEVLAAAQAHARGLGIATVYRAIKSLLAERFLVTVELPGEPARYEVAGKDHHHHFLCKRCGKMYEVEGCPKNLLAMVPQGFQLEGHDVLLYGACDKCRGAARQV